MAKKKPTRDLLVLMPSEDMLVDRLLWVARRLRESADKIDRWILEYRMGDMMSIRTLLRNPTRLYQNVTHEVLWMLPNLGFDTCMPIVDKAQHEIANPVEEPEDDQIPETTD